MRRLSHFRMLTICVVPIMVAASMSILIETKPRRRLLAVYMANIAVETLFRMAESRGYVKSIPYGEVVLFSIALSIYLYLYRIKKCGRTVSSLFSFLLGTEEQASSSSSASPRENRVAAMLSKLFVPKNAKSKHCPHTYSCLQYILQGVVKPFAVGVGIQYSLTTFSSVKLLLKREYYRALSGFFHLKHFSLAAFLASLALLFRLCQCSLRRIHKSNREWHAAVSGCIAGVSLCFYRSSSLALYLASKLCENLCSQAHYAGYLPSVPGSDVILYTLATTVAFHGLVFEPHNLRPSYYTFLDSASNSFFGRINRRLLDEFGTGASKMNPLYWPKLDPGFSSLRHEDYPPLFAPPLRQNGF